MRNYILTTIVLLLAFLQVEAQANKKKQSETRYTAILQAGLLEGSADKSFGQFQLLNGIQHNAWFYGLGLGIDYYGPKRSVPLFLDARWDLIKGKSTPFIYADGGYNFSWLRDDEKTVFFGNDYKESGGPYYDAGLGYKVNLKNKMAIGFSAGYSFKQQKETFTRSIFSDFLPFPQNNNNQQPDVYEYKFRRISLKLNCSF